MAVPPIPSKFCLGKRKRGQYCVAAWCSNFFGCRIDEPISFFSFPKEQPRANAWLKFALREDLMVRDLKNLRLCSDHFLERDFRSKRPRVLLKTDAIPSQYERRLSVTNGQVVSGDSYMTAEKNSKAFPEICVADASVPLTIPEMVVTVDASLEAPEPPLATSPTTNEASTPKCRGSIRSTPTPRTARRIVHYKGTIARLRSNLFRAKAKRNKGKAEIEREQLAQLSKKYLPKSSQKLFMAQMKLNTLSKYGCRWSPYMKDFALSLYYHGPKAYRFVQKTLCLPSVRSLINWQKEVLVKPGIDDNALAALEAQAKNLTESDLMLSLVIDEMAIRKNLFYDCTVDSILGFCDYGDDTKPIIGNQCLVAMVKGINKKWKQCIGYWVTHNSTSADVLQKIVLDCISKVNSVGFRIKVLICDQGPHNLKLSRNLGITPETPFFMVGEEKIYFMFDPPHLLKSIRNNLTRYNFSFNGNLVEWSHLKKLFELTDPLKLKMIPKITKFHIDVKAFKKMRVKLASQVFSNSVSVAISAFVAMGKLSSQSENTAVFFDFMDRLFDTFNSSQIKRHPFKYCYAIGEGTPHVEFLRDAFAKLKASHFVGCKRPPCMNGWLISINSLLGLYSDMKDHGISKICTRVLNQDALENFFSVIRQQHGCNDNPTVMQFGKGYKHLLLTSLSKLTSVSNCELDLENFLVRISDLICKNRDKCTSASQSEVNFNVVNFSDLNISDFLDVSDFKVIESNCELLCRTFMKYHKCSACIEAMTTSTGKCMFFNAVKEWEGVFECVFMENIQLKGLAKYIETIMMDTRSYISMELPCEVSRQVFLRIFIKFRIYYALRSLNEEYLQ